jgi:hypothetical protein
MLLMVSEDSTSSVIISPYKGPNLGLHHRYFPKTIQKS